MPRGIPKNKNGAAKDRLTENDRLSTLVAREKHGRCQAEVTALESQILVLQTTLQTAHKNLEEAVAEHRDVFKQHQKTYGTDDAAQYNLETGAITRVNKDAENAAS